MTTTTETSFTAQSLFSSLTTDQVAAISSFSSVKEFDAGQVVYQYNHPANFLFALLEGSVALRKPAGAQKDFSVIIDRVNPGGIFGATLLFGQPRYLLEAQALTNSKIMFIESEAFKSLLEKDLIVGNAIMQKLGITYYNRYIEVMKKIGKIIADLED